MWKKMLNSIWQMCPTSWAERLSCHVSANELKHPLLLEAQPSCRDGSLLLSPKTLSLHCQAALTSMFSVASSCALPDLILRYPALCLPHLPWGRNLGAPYTGHISLLRTSQGWKAQKVMFHTSPGFLCLATTDFGGLGNSFLGPIPCTVACLAVFLAWTH